jgi:hypothetical protein
MVVGLLTSVRGWWLVEKRIPVTYCDKGITLKLAHDVVDLYLAVLKMNTITNSSSKPIQANPANPAMFLMGKLMGYILKYYRNSNLFLLCVISS